MTNYTARNWHVASVPLRAKDNYPLTSSGIPDSNICAMMSPMADTLDRYGKTNVFYVDVEQEEAGLDAMYGSSGLYKAAEDFTLDDGFVVKAGALVFPVTKMDMSDPANVTHTILFEKI